MTSTLSDRAYALIRDELVTLVIPPGAAISEDDLMTRHKLGRTPVREAIKRLALESLVEIFPRRGTFAAEIQLTDLSAISEVRVALETQAAGLAARRIGAAEAAELSRLRSKLRDSFDAGGAALLEADASVHRSIYRWSRNPYLEDTLTRYLNLSLRIWHLVLNRVPAAANSVKEHEALLDAIEQGDEETARSLAGAHVRNFENAIRSVL